MASSSEHETLDTRLEKLYVLLTKSLTEYSSKEICPGLMSLETLLDAIFLLYDECNNDFLMKDSFIAAFIEKYRSSLLKVKDLYITNTDFEQVKIIWKGRFAEIAVVREKHSHNIRVIKKIRKTNVFNIHEPVLFESERNALVSALKDENARKWVTRLYYSFQDSKYLYFVLEYCPGGNLSGMLEYYKKNMPEPMIKFYLAEIIEAINCVHSMGYVHRDIKPENIVIDYLGHIKLADFSTSAKISKNGLLNQKMAISTPHYTAPEIFKFRDDPNSRGYGNKCDWWSLGILLFELITGSVPFTSDDVSKLHNWSSYTRKFQFPNELNVTAELKHIVNNLLQPVDKRFGYERLIKLKYFNSVDWSNLHNRDTPFIPNISSPDDTTYFKTLDIQKPSPKIEDYKLQRRFTGKNLPFLGFTYIGEVTSHQSPFKQIQTYSEGIQVGSSMCNYHSSMQRACLVKHSTGNVSDCSAESYKSAASVRLENEVDLLHLSYNEKALVIEERIQNKFRDVYNYLTEDKERVVNEKDDLFDKLTVMEEKLKFANNELVNSQTLLQHQIQDSINEREELKRMYEGKLNELKEKNEKPSSRIFNTEGATSPVFDSYQKEYVELQTKLSKANEEVAQLKSDIEKNNKIKFDLELKMTSNNKKIAHKRISTLPNNTSETSHVEKEKKESLESADSEAESKVLMSFTKKLSKLPAEISRNQTEIINIFKTQIESFESQLEKKECAINNYHKESIELRKELSSLEKVNSELRAQMKINGDKILALQAERINSDKLITQITDTLKESLSSQDKGKQTELESMFNKVQRKLSILAENHTEETLICKRCETLPTVDVLKDEIKRLEILLSKHESSIEYDRQENQRLLTKIVSLEKTSAKNDLKLKISEEQIQALHNERINSENLVRQITGVLKENSNNINVNDFEKVTDLKTMLGDLQSKLSLLTKDHQNSQKKNCDTCLTSGEESSVIVLQAQVERLEKQLEKSREMTILKREEANQSKNNLAVIEKELNNCRLDLRGMQRENKELGDQIKKLQEQIKNQSLNNYAKIKENNDKIVLYEKRINELEKELQEKVDMMANIEEENTAMVSFARNFNEIKTQNTSLQNEKNEVMLKMERKEQKINSLEDKIKSLCSEITVKNTLIDNFKQKEKDWIAKDKQFNKEATALQEACDLQYQLNLKFENNKQNMQKEINSHQNELKAIKEKFENVQKELSLEKLSRSNENEITERLKQEVEKLNSEMDLFVQRNNENHEIIDVLEEKVQVLEQNLAASHESVQLTTNYANNLKNELDHLKINRSDLLTKIHQINEHNSSLQQELNDAIEEINNLQQGYNESQSILNQAKAYWEDRHIKDATTLHQYSKLNEFLQSKVDDKKQKRNLVGKFLKPRDKENFNPKNVENLLDLERKRNRTLTDQIYEMRMEIMALKGSGDNLINYTPVKNINRNDAVLSKLSTPIHARMNHNIPHKFETKLCHKLGVKCIVCGNSVNFGHMSHCVECNVRCHVSCSIKMEPTCGLSKVLMSQIPFNIQQQSEVKSSSRIKKSTMNFQNETALSNTPLSTYESDIISRGFLVHEDMSVYHINQITSLSPEIMLLATDRGLFSLRMSVKDGVFQKNTPIKIRGLEEIVSDVTILPKLRLALFICGSKRLVKKCDLRLLVSNAEAAECSSPEIDITDINSSSHIENCHTLTASSCNYMLAISTDKNVWIIKYNDNSFDEIVFSWDLTDEITSMIFTTTSLFCYSQKEIHIINLEKYDRLKLEIFEKIVSDSYSISVIAIVRINKNLFLICDQLYGIYVNANGEQIKNLKKLKWHIPPHDIAYLKPFLVLSHETCVSFMYLPISDDENNFKCKFEMIDYNKPSILGIVKEPTNEETSVYSIRGVFIRNIIKGKEQIIFMEPVKYLRERRNSFSSLNTQITGETTDEECVYKNLTIQDDSETEISFSALDE